MQRWKIPAIMHGFPSFPRKRESSFDAVEENVTVLSERHGWIPASAGMTTTPAIMHAFPSFLRKRESSFDAAEENVTVPSRRHGWIPASAGMTL
ncbi:MAG TPA: hypothetical protein VGR63_05550 [Casimicrobiaceae bacterium]|nr:hypothetical protein [Casimicrobiaceae bacterium]